jgi:hypothetical protein
MRFQVLRDRELADGRKLKAGEMVDVSPVEARKLIRQGVLRLRVPREPKERK